MNIDLIKEILITSIASSIIATATIQKIKEVLKSKKFLHLASFITSIIIGVLFALSFTNLSVVNSFWSGLITWVGADAIYKAFEDKIFKPFSKMEEIKEIERG